MAKLILIYCYLNKADPTILKTSYLYNLYSRLIDGYNTDVRPVFNQSTKTYVTLDFTLLQLVNMVSKHGFFFALNEF